MHRSNLNRLIVNIEVVIRYLICLDAQPGLIVMVLFNNSITTLKILPYSLHSNGYCEIRTNIKAQCL